MVWGRLDTTCKKIQKYCSCLRQVFSEMPFFVFPGKNKVLFQTAHRICTKYLGTSGHKTCCQNPRIIDNAFSVL